MLVFLVGMMIGLITPSAAHAEIGNDGYPYGKNMGTNTITLVCDATGGTSYQWQSATSKDGPFSSITGATLSEYTFTPENCAWYRCIVNGNESNAIQTVKPSNSDGATSADGRIWTKPYRNNSESVWYLTNGSVAYMTNGSKFDVTGKYTKNGTTYMLGTSFGRYWQMYSGSSTANDSFSNIIVKFSFEGVGVKFDVKFPINVDGDFCFACDTMLGNSNTSGNYSDKAALVAELNSDKTLKHIAMVGASQVNDQTDPNAPSFVIAPTENPMFWIGYYNNRQTYAYNTNDSNTTGNKTDVKKHNDPSNTINAFTYVYQTDSGMTVSWKSVNSVQFSFKVGTAKETGAVSGQVDYHTEMLTGLKAETSYDIYVVEDGTAVFVATVTSDTQGRIPLVSTNPPYNLIGKTIRISLHDNEQTTSDPIIVNDRPTPEEANVEGDDPYTRPEDVANNEVTSTSDTITIHLLSDSKKLQEYRLYAMNGDPLSEWSLPNQGVIQYSNLNSKTQYRLKARVPATDNAPCSAESTGIIIETKGVFEITEPTDTIATYNGDSHSWTITVGQIESENVTTVTYCTKEEDQYIETVPSFTDVGVYTVFYRVRNVDYSTVYDSFNVEITAAPVTVSGIAGPTDKVYDGATGATLDYSNMVLAGVVEKDAANLTATATGTFEDKNVGEDKKIAISNLALSGAASGNYALANSGQQAEATGTIIPKEVTVSGITASNKIYDGNTKATLNCNGAVFGGIVDGDTLTVIADGAFTDENVGNEKTVTISNLILGGASAGNYTLAENGQQTTTKANITPNNLNVTANDYTDVYDGDYHSISVSTDAEGVSVTYSETENGEYSATNPQYKDAGNYPVWYKAEKTGSTTINGFKTVTINKQAVTVSGIAASNKPYDGNTDATLIYTDAVLDGKLENDTLTVTGKGTFDNADVGEEKTVTISNLTLGGDSAGNYQLAEEGQQTTTTASITANPLNIKADGYTGIYDGAPHSILVTTEEAGVTITYSESEDGTYVDDNPTYTNAGKYTVWYKAEKTGSVTMAGPKDVEISPKDITVSGIAASNKPYDGKTDATLIYTDAVLDGKLENDTLTVTGKGTFDNADVGEEKTVTISNLTLGGDSAGNYQLAEEGQQTTTTASITANPLNIKADGYTGIYDGAPHSILVTTEEAGVTITYSEIENGTYSNENPAYTNAGTYTVWYKAEKTGSTAVAGALEVAIGKKDVTVSGITALDKPYDGNTDATLDCTKAVINGKLEKDTLIVTAKGAFADADVGEGKTVKISGLTLGGGSAGNYQLAEEGQQTTTTASITANPLSIKADGYTGIYDGESHSISVTTEEDGVTITYSEIENGTYSNENPAYTNAGKYTVWYKAEKTGSTAMTGALEVAIGKKDVTVSGITAQDKPYDGNTAAVLDCSGAVFAGKLDKDTLTITAKGMFTDADVGEDKTITISNLVLGGESAGNYQLAEEGQQAETTASITANELKLTAAAYTGIYDGEPHSISVTSEENGVSITYSETETGAYSAVNPAYTNAGTYTVWYKAEKTGSATVTGALTVAIGKKDVTVSGIKAADKPYDGKTDATLDFSGAAFKGKLDKDTLTVTATGTFADAEAGENKTVVISGLTLDGESAGNYQLAAEGQQKTATASIIAPREGTLDVKVISDPGAPEIQDTNLGEIALTLVSEEEKGKDVRIWMECTKINESQVPEEDHRILMMAVDELGAEAYMWIDLNMFMQVENGEIRQITETLKEVSFSIAVPEELKKPGRTFYLIRVHNGERKVLASTTGDVLEGKTNLFSTYMIAYKDAPTATPTPEPTATPTATPTPTPAPTPTPKPVPKTGDSGNPALWAGMIACGMILLAVMMIPARKKKR